MKLSSADNIIEKIVDDMSPIAKLIDSLIDDGYYQNFIQLDNKLMCTENKKFYWLNDFDVEKIYRIDDSEIGLVGFYLYVLRLRSASLKGIFVTQLRSS